MLDIKNITFKAGNFKSAKINLHFDDSKCHAIVGPTGSGKTLLIETIIGLREIESGSIILNGSDISNLPVEKRGFSYVPQDLALFPHLSVEKNIYYPLRFINEGKNKSAMVHELIEIMNIGHILKRPVTNLSGGEKQRTTLVRAIASGSKYLFLDEPLSSLHESMKKDLRFLLKDIQKKFNLTIFIITHDLNEAFFLGDTLTVLIDGEIHQSGEKNMVYKSPATVEAANFFGIKNIFTGRIESISDKSFTAFCDELGKNLKIEYDKRRHSCLRKSAVFGIRPEEIMILRPGPVKKSRSNLLKGTITEIYEKGSFITVIFQEEKTKTLVEIELIIYAFKKLSIKKGKKVRIIFKEESIFVCN
jgi:ABC-type Fe3+/spermidine/putrescine transport system ATPase subunit